MKLLKRLEKEELDALQEEERIALAARADWLGRADSPDRKGKQRLPGGDWTILLVRAGRGFGKTEMLVQAGWWDCYEFPGLIVHALAPTQSDVRGTLFEGPVGFCNVVPKELLLGCSLDKAYNKSTHELRFKNGSLIRGFSTTEQANRLRGPQCNLMLGDELAAWDVPAGNLETAFNVSMFGVRLPYPKGLNGEFLPARAVLGTTPRPIGFLKRLERRDDVKVITGSSFENINNLSGAYRAQIMNLAGTKIGKQEIEGLYVDEENDQSIFKRGWFRLWPCEKKLPEFSFVMEVYDTAFTEETFDRKRQESDPTACLILGVFNINAAFTESERRQMNVRAKYGVVICDAWAERLGFPELMDRARKQHRLKWGAQGKRSDIVLIEEKGSGISLRQSLGKHGVPTWPYNPGRQSKLIRANAISPIVAQGMVFVPESMRPERKGLPRDWVEPFLEQVCAYYGPGTTEHDDYVDVLSSGLLYLRNRSMLESTTENKYLDMDEKREQDERKAQQIYYNQKSSSRGNPYG